MKKKTIGIILIVVSVLNMITWIPDAFKGKSEGALYYIFIVAIFIIGFNLVADYRKSVTDKSDLLSILSKEKVKDVDLPLVYKSLPLKSQIELKYKKGLRLLLFKTLEKIKHEPDLIKSLLIKNAASNYSQSFKESYNSILESCRRSNTSVPYSNDQYQTMIDKKTVEVIAEFIDPINETKLNHKP